LSNFWGVGSTKQSATNVLSASEVKEQWVRIQPPFEFLSVFAHKPTYPNPSKYTLHYHTKCHSRQYIFFTIQEIGFSVYYNQMLILHCHFNQLGNMSTSILIKPKQTWQEWVGTIYPWASLTKYPPLVWMATLASISPQLTLFTPNSV
jgi:hypothetical protein